MVTQKYFYWPTLTTRRLECGFSKADLSRAADVSVDTITKIEKNYRAQEPTLHKILHALNQCKSRENSNKLDPLVEFSCEGLGNTRKA